MTRALDERHESLIRQLEQYPEILGDYQKTNGMDPMVTAEETVRVFAKG